MAQILSKADFAEADATFRASIELEYLFNVVCFDYDSLQCELKTTLDPTTSQKRSFFYII